MPNSVMADCLNMFLRTKCSASRKGPKLQILIWSFFINSFFFMPSVYSLCLGVNTTVSLYPTDVSVLYGNPLELFCEEESVKNTQFKLSNRVLESEIISNTTRRLYFSKPEKQANVYFCTNVKTSKNCITHVVVDTPPENVHNFSCTSFNLEILNCSWTNPKMFSALNVSLSWYRHNALVEPLCHINSVTDNLQEKYCVWRSNKKPAYDQQLEMLKFELKICNVFGCANQSYNIRHSTIVKPGHPLDLKVLNQGSHYITLNWNIPFNIVDYLDCGVEHIIEYQIVKMDNATYFRSVNSSYLPLNKSSYVFKIRNLPYAHMLYRVRVYIKSKDAKERLYWSNFSSVDVYTLSENPKRPPDLVAGSFTQNTYGGRRFIYIYWKQIEEFEEAGENFTYKVIVKQDDIQKVVSNVNNTLSYASYNATESALHVRIWSMNNNGTSNNFSYLYIPPVQNSLQFSNKFTKLYYENGTYELSWVPMENIDNYTLFWCIHNMSKICTGRMNFEVLDPEKSKHIINYLPTQHRYQFAIAANNGTSTSGMVWTKCEISKDGFAMFTFPVTLSYDAPGKTFVNLKWTMDCIVQKGIILGYNISYCPIVKTTTTCEEKQHFFPIRDPEKTELRIEDLQPYRTYQFTLSLDTIYGSKIEDNTTVVVTTSEDKPKSPNNITISDVTYNSLVISWVPPKHKNTVIHRYVISNDTQQLGVKYVNDSLLATDTSRQQVTLTNLLSFSNYSLTVQACSIKKDCSKIEPHDKKFVRTSIGPPSKMKSPTVESSPDLLKWLPPEIPGGTLDLYQVLRIIDNNAPPPPLNTTALSMPLFHCSSSTSRETYQVRAINFDRDPHHGAIYDTNEYEPLQTSNEEIVLEYPGEWSEPSVIACRNSFNVMFVVVFLIIVVGGGIVLVGTLLYRKYKRKTDIKAIFPEGIIIEKDTAKYTFEWNPTNKDQKAASDEMSLLPKSKSETSVTDRHNEALSDITDGTILSDLTRTVVEHQTSVSDESTDSCPNSGAEPVNNDDKSGDNKEKPSAEKSNSCVSSADLNVQPFINNAQNSYVQLTNNPVSNTVTSNKVTAQPVDTPYFPCVNSLPSIKSCKPSETPVNWQSPPGIGASRPPSTPPSPAYVMASSTFFKNVPHQKQNGNSSIKDGSHYNSEKSVAAMNFTNVSQSPHKVLHAKHLPALSSLPVSASIIPDNSIQLEMSDSLPSFKNSLHNTVPLKNPTMSNGYVSHSDAVDKHLNNMTTGSQFDDDIILDPAMSANAYTRFSWSSNPTNDNLHSLLNESVESTESN